MLYNIKLEWRRYWKEMVHFKVNLIFANIGLLTLFSGMLSSLDIVNREVVFFLMFIWYSATHGFANINFIIEEEVMDGTLAHIVGSKISFLNIICLRSFIQIIYDLVKSFIVFGIVLMFIQFDYSLYSLSDYTLIFMFIMFSILISYCIGLILGVLALKYKKISALPNLLYYFVFFFGGITYEIPSTSSLFLLSYIFPFTPMRLILVDLQAGSLNYICLIILFLQFLIYACLGVLLYKVIMNINYKNGSLYHV